MFHLVDPPKGLEGTFAAIAERAERRIRAGVVTMTANRANGSGAGLNVIVRPMGMLLLLTTDT